MRTRFLGLSSAFLVIGFVVLVSTLVFSAAEVRAGAILEVNSTLDSDDGSCDPLAGAVECTLREALNLAGDNDIIRFNIPASDPNCTASLVCTITPATSLPDLDGIGKTINGYSQPGASANTLDVGSDAILKIEIDMALLPLHAISVTGDSMTVGGLAIYGHPGAVSGAFAAIQTDGASGANIRGNFLGLKANGTDGGNGNQTFGVYARLTTSSTIGGTEPEHRNVMSGLGVGVFVGIDSQDVSVVGNYIGTNPAGTTAIGNQDGIALTNSVNSQIGDPSMITGRNVISGNVTGINVNGAAANLKVQGNYIGIKASGAQALPNTIGVMIDFAGSASALIGGVDAGNIISGNNLGIETRGSGHTLSVEGNRIGTNPAGTSAIPNLTGILLAETDETTIGGSLPGQGNLISGNSTTGILITLSSFLYEATVAGNQIGTNLVGTGAIANGTGINVVEGDDIVIGGSTATARNTISGNTVNGVLVGALASNTVIERNYIGTVVSGLAAVPNLAGVTTAGSHTEVSLNVISGNTGYGLGLSGENTVVQGNFIGVSQLLIPLGNGEGIAVVSGATGRIENVPSGPPNVIAHNAADGVRFDAGAPDSAVSINRNSIFANGGLGIDLNNDGVSGNDPNDSDSGANDRQNWPVLTSAESGSTLVRGTLDTLPNRAYTFEMFAVAACDPSGNGEGTLYGGAATLNTDGDGFITFAVQSSATAAVGSFITATVTDQTTGDTSEFSNCVPVVAAPTPSPTPSPTLPGQTPTPTPGGLTPTPTTTPIPIETPPPSGEVTDGPTPTETPTPTATPGTPSPTPTGGDIHRQGDNDCSGVVTGRDSLFAFLFIAQLAGEGFPPCPAVGADIGFIWGDVDCDGDVDADDGINLLLWLAGFEVEQIDPCNDIGEGFPT